MYTVKTKLDIYVAIKRTSFYHFQALSSDSDKIFSDTHRGACTYFDYLNVNITMSHFLTSFWSATVTKSVLRHLIRDEDFLIICIF